ncbi:MAG: hypothetical protein J6Y62_04575 [Clostridia bacterium]|nr:hypothetical protein [Clostridia bacterium]
MSMHPLSKLIEVLNDLDDCYVDVPGYIMDGIINYLDEYKCCAFCKNKGQHDGCLEGDQALNRLQWCDHWRDRREDCDAREYSVWDFYKDFEKRPVGNVDPSKIKTAVMSSKIRYVRYDGDNYEEVKALCGDRLITDFWESRRIGHLDLAGKTPRRDMDSWTVEKGDVVVMDENGECEAWSPEAFEEWFKEFGG